MIWHLISDGEKSGSYNMGVDIELAKNCPDDEAFLRLYRWKPYCISLGANQDKSDLDIAKVERDGLEIVKRPTGGRAVLHAEELTYSVNLPTSIGLTAKEIYNKISVSIIKGLQLFDPAFNDLTLEDETPFFPALLKKPEGILCFSTTSKNEIKYRNMKLVGSAQRKLNNVILQHGSILCGKYHRRLTGYLNPSGVKENHLDSVTTEIESVTGKNVDYSILRKCIVEGFKQTWQIEEMIILNYSLLPEYN
ncbi:MAG: hypothetical protein JW995_06675 [Melioribacteraceae bacterium]|nr:hypothetical protein [Melioribacteraceae bacterium]